MSYKLNSCLAWLLQITLMISVFFITPVCACSGVFVCAATCSLFLQSVSAWVLWGKASAAEAHSHTSHCKQGL